MFKQYDAVLKAVRAGFYHARVLVIGDIILDRYIWGNVHRISPEAPVPVVQVTKTSETVGGAGNVALNLVGLGIQTTLAGYVGADEDGTHLLGLLGQAGINSALIHRENQRPTITKTRVIGGRQQMIRFDVEDCSAPSQESQQFLQGMIYSQLNKQHYDAIILSDYAKGTLGVEFCKEVIEIANRNQLPVLVDPKGRDFSKYAGAYLLSPNRLELAAATGSNTHDLDALMQAGEKLRKSLNADVLAATMGELGISLIEADGVHNFPAMAREVFDVSGAGDTVIATLAAGVVAQLNLHDVTHLANLAAGVVVAKVGTVPISQQELQMAIDSEESSAQINKFCEIETAIKRVAEWRAHGDRIVFTNGCFDLLHVGHVSYLERARQEGHRLIVGLNSDRSVRALKGPTRPMIKEHERARVLAALASVDLVVIFDEDTPLKLIDAFRPEVLAKGADYTEAQVVGADEIKAWGGRVALIQLIEGASTTNIVKNLAQSTSDS